MTNTIPDTPTLREVLDRGDDPADLLGGYDYLEDIVVSAATADDIDRRTADMLDTLERIGQMKADGLPIIRDPAGLYDLAMRTRWEVEMMLDRDILGRLLREHPHGEEMTDSVAAYYRFVGLRVETVREDGYETCNACHRDLVEGERALVVSEVALCFPCLRPALAGVDLATVRYRCDDCGHVGDVVDGADIACRCGSPNLSIGDES